MSEKKGPAAAHTFMEFSQQHQQPKDAIHTLIDDSKWQPLVDFCNYTKRFTPSYFFVVNVLFFLYRLPSFNSVYHHEVVGL